MECSKIIERDDLIQVHLNTTIQEVSGSIGNFHVDYSSESENGIIEVGAIIVATGGEVNKPEGKYLYGENPNILTLLDLELKLKNDELQDFSRIGIIHCVGSRNPEDHSYCSTICCTVSLKNIISLKERLPNCEITSLYQDMCVFNKDEELYRNARSLANFVQYEKEDDIKVIARDDGLLEIEVNNIFSGEPVKFKVNKLILATPIIPSSTSPALSQILKVPRAYNGFFLEAHVKHRPLDFASDGIFLCGTCQSPNFIRETVSQARGAAGRALIPLLKGEIESEAVIAEVDVEKCIGCEICKINCPYGAITMKENEQGELKSLVIESVCKGCGVCAAGCPADAITIKHFTNQQINNMIDVALTNPALKTEPKIIAFLCNWCSYAGADNAGVSRFQYSPSVRVIRVMCSGRINILHLLEAFKAGADGVMVLGCHIGDCHYISGNLHAQRRVNMAKRLVELAGINPERLKLEWVSAAEGKKFAQLINDFIAELEEMKKNENMFLMHKLK
ncbi:MAG: hydrogenase iron-sulfur subunit [Candidatus Helarchaeota archaeon]